MKQNIARVNQFLLFSILLTIVLLYGRPILVPLIFASMLAMLMAPVCRALDGRKWPRALSCVVCIFILLVIMLAVISVVSAQIVSFSDNLPELERRVNLMLERIQTFIYRNFNMSPGEQMEYLKNQGQTLAESAGSYVGAVVGGVLGMIGNAGIILVLTFLMLYNKEMYENFFIKLYKEQGTSDMKKILSDITLVSQQYLTGRIISMSIQAALFSTGLLIIGVENAILLGCIAGLLTIIPYIGPYVGGAFPVMMSLITGDSLQQTLWVIILLVIVQFFDNTFVEPNVVGGKVKLGALATIVAIIIGGMLWGVMGMILFIPMLGIVKIVFDHVPELEPYAYIISDPDEGTPSFFDRLLKRFKRS
jgi:predicted PurR-regulated permease PerM